MILLDEMEKAHPGVQDIFFQVFDKGNMKDGEGRDIDFKNAVIIMTSNAGTDLITRLCADPGTAPDAAGLAEALMPELMKVFKPAFLGRVTLVPYFPLAPDIIKKIVELQLNRVRRRVQETYGAKFAWDKSLVQIIAGCCTIIGCTRRNPLANAAPGVVCGSLIAPCRRCIDQWNHSGRGYGWVVPVPYSATLNEIG